MLRNILLLSLVFGASKEEDEKKGNPANLPMIKPPIVYS